MSTSKQCRTNKWDQSKGTRRQEGDELTEMAVENNACIYFQLSVAAFKGMISHRTQKPRDFPGQESNG